MRHFLYNSFYCKNIYDSNNLFVFLIQCNMFPKYLYGLKIMQFMHFINAHRLYVGSLHGANTLGRIGPTSCQWQVDFMVMNLALEAALRQLQSQNWLYCKHFCS